MFFYRLTIIVRAHYLFRSYIRDALDYGVLQHKLMQCRLMFLYGLTIIVRDNWSQIAVQCRAVDPSIVKTIEDKLYNTASLVLRTHNKHCPGLRLLSLDLIQYSI